jgi:hypothetical protein
MIEIRKIESKENMKFSRKKQETEMLSLHFISEMQRKEILQEKKRKGKSLSIFLFKQIVVELKDHQFFGMHQTLLDHLDYYQFRRIHL